jgi:hypothetical protein
MPETASRGAKLYAAGHGPQVFPPEAREARSAAGAKVFGNWSRKRGYLAYFFAP